MTNPLVKVTDLCVEFNGARRARALDHVSFDIQPGEVLGLLGESGSGKSVTLRTLLRLHPQRTTRIGGSIQVDGKEVLDLKGKDLDHYRGGTVSMIFQEPGLAFDPVYTIGQQIVETIRAHDAVDKATAAKRALEMLERVQIPQAKRRFDAYPHELSGGMRQRAMIALALSCRPKLLLADEPTTALDASVQIQILLLLRELQKETGMSVIFVTHDIGAAVEVADRIAVMYGGRIIEENSVKGIVTSPMHPYTAGLLGSTVSSDNRGKPLPAVRGAPPNLAAIPPGCTFAPRCDNASERCTKDRPALLSADGARLACWHPVRELVPRHINLACV
ncbi:ABC transporter ATP-binding protein [uncultured Oxalicibacterium sp.]|uniref:ABC transporter ATP-binding protein n=1 Tax=uncultured Oxalicibacterium sp. TaxID=1168540 RepID=UPI0025EF46FC|nr:ABC transporter ATP-binding protein [uncultured Oxalicibacterium sp.]